MPSKLIFWHVSSNRIGSSKEPENLSVLIVGGCKSVSRYDCAPIYHACTLLVSSNPMGYIPEHGHQIVRPQGVGRALESARTSTIDKRMQQRVLARLDVLDQPTN